MDFLTELLDQGFSYQAVNSAKSAILSICQEKFTHDNARLLKQFMKGVFEKRPFFPLYTSTWDVNKVFKVIETWDNASCPLEFLSYKTVILLLLLSGRRGGSIVQICVKDIFIEGEIMVIKINHKTKTSNNKHHVPDIKLKRFENKDLCPVGVMESYLQRTEGGRSEGNNKLFISYQTLKPISRSTLSRWVKIVMDKAGIDLKRFKSHSTRAASTSRAIAQGVSLATIMASVGWKQANTIARFYSKTIEDDTGMQQMLQQ